LKNRAAGPKILAYEDPDLSGARSFPEPEAYLRAARRLGRWLRACVLCPRACRVDRTRGELGFCRAGLTAPVNLAQLHFDEEPPISGRRGSGAVFFAGCTLACRFCQNQAISQGGSGEELDAQGLAEVFLSLERSGAHNLNLVTPTPHLPVILEALALARGRGLGLPVVYNTSGYERPAALKLLEGLIEIYLPDYKYASDEVAARLSGAGNYVGPARAAIAEMHRQTGPLRLNDEGLAEGGVLVRHLVLPGDLAGTAEVLRDLVRLAGPQVFVSLMSQYTPVHLAAQTPGLERRLLPREYAAAWAALEAAGIENGFVQELSSASTSYVPAFRERSRPPVRQRP